ncbi:maleate cis-trans isomerase family protein [Moorella sp. Hama-1]|uniref:maleate cis-trans isomerase family protein n=1 Tax=Moorella sp. Hama-1 TaxID=2138101 RepID=UPI000D64BACA|nr:aspartate/glutamate racemase family protein [Moorella sp. Hama-1]BCV21318.1 maleate cis-trans isomerase [Moorella sp. Hama-1]
MQQRLGLIVPSSNSVMEVDFYRHLPNSITLHVARMYLRDTTVAGEEEMLDSHFPIALRDLATVEPQAIVFGCTSAGALRGNAYDSELCRRISDTARCPAISTVASVRESLKKRGMHRVAVITPYIESLNERIQASLEADGLEVALIAGLGIDYNFAIAGVTPEEILSFTLKTIEGQKIDGIFLSCTNFHALDVRDRLEYLTGLPVVTSNQAALEQALSVLEQEEA